MKQLNERIAERIISIPDYPVNGVIFRDVMPVFTDAELFRDIILAFADFHKNDNVDVVAGVEARGFIFGGALATALGCGFVPIRKAGKLPRECVTESYELEYGLGVIEAQKDSMKPGQRVVIIDDLLATGGTVNAVARLVRKLGAKVIASDFMVELGFLNPRPNLVGCGTVNSLLPYH